MTQRRPAVYKHVFKVVVLNTDPNYRQEDLRGISEDITIGDSIGQWSQEASVAVAPRRVRAELRAIANDGSFFDPV